MVSWNEVYATKRVNPGKCDCCDETNNLRWETGEGRWLCESCRECWPADSNEEADDVQVDQR